MALAQSHYRFGIDELAESTHGWHAAENTDPAAGVLGLDTTFLLRFNVQASGGVAHSNTDFQFQYSHNGGAFTNITTTSSAVRAVASVAFTNGANCTKRLSGTGTFESSGAGCTEDGLSGGNSNDIAANGCSETECGLQILSADVANGDTLAFRLTSPDAAITYTVTPGYTVVVETEILADGATALDALPNAVSTAQLDVIAAASGALGALADGGTAQADIAATASGSLDAIADGGTFTIESGGLSLDGATDFAALTLAATVQLDVAADVAAALGALPSAGTAALVLAAAASGALGQLDGGGVAAALVTAESASALASMAGGGTAALELRAASSEALDALTGGGTLTIGTALALDGTTALDALTVASTAAVACTAQLGGSMQPLALDADAQCDVMATMSVSLGSLSIAGAVAIDTIADMAAPMDSLLLNATATTQEGAPIYLAGDLTCYVSGPSSPPTHTVKRFGHGLHRN